MPGLDNLSISSNLNAMAVVYFTAVIIHNRITAGCKTSSREGRSNHEFRKLSRN